MIATFVSWVSIVLLLTVVKPTESLHSQHFVLREYISGLSSVVAASNKPVKPVHLRKRYASVSQAACRDNPLEYYQCNSTVSCIRTHYFCDGENDCPEGDDERNCTSYVCPEGTVKCNDTGVCVRRDKVCDGCMDCANGDDERNCTKKRCTGAQFWCMTTNDCLPLVWVCDGEPQCPNGEDELCNVRTEAEVVSINSAHNLTYTVQGQSIRNGSDVPGIIYKRWNVTVPQGLQMFAFINDLTLGPTCGPSTLSMYTGGSKVVEVCGDSTPSWTIRSFESMFTVELLYFGFDGKTRGFNIGFEIDPFGILG